ncbi:hypothetical protein CPB84DRAFT_1789585 [Gymnopilus junonius]|uniref:Polymerase beta nucleotidyltransferase domain-containing protein n=1 Tax=Gymnopilus junonius TaxID=109634 RepID=A0A9P5NDN3_GYMJU|nr:hypothetical protein CPB84DRAFT_1789585 [Gymnopilus junonius]
MQTLTHFSWCTIRRRLSIRPSTNYHRFYLKEHHKYAIMSIPTFDYVKKCLAPVWEDEEYKRDILWAGVFGSVARNRAREESDVDVLIVLKEHERSGEPIDLRERLAETCAREVSLMCIWQGPDWAWGHVRVEALLSSRTVYGNRQDVEHLRQEAMTILENGLTRFNNVADAVEKLKKCVAGVQTLENFIGPSREYAREVCILELRKNPLNWLDVTAGDAPIWRIIWAHLQPTSMTMWCLDSGCAVGGRKYIRHILASKRLADRFEEGGEVEGNMYKDIIR